MWWDEILEGIHPGWAAIFHSPEVQPYLMKALASLAPELQRAAQGGKRVVPDLGNILEAFRYFSPADLRVVIIAQDPYYNVIQAKDGPVPQAQGLCFSCHPDTSRVQPSLNNIRDAAVQEMSEQAAAMGVDLNTLLKHHRMGVLDAPYTLKDLRFWAAQGVLLLNRALTTLEGQAGAHLLIWEDFTEAVVTYLSMRRDRPPPVFLLWGNPAKKLRKSIERAGGRGIFHEWSHPSPTADSSRIDDPKADRPKFKHCGHFKKANLDLSKAGHAKPIQWLETATLAATDGGCDDNGKKNAKAGFGLLVDSGPLAGLRMYGPVQPFTYEWTNPANPLNGFRPTTTPIAPSNNRGEMLAMCYCLLAICRAGLTAPVIIVCDSDLTIKTLDIWVHKWKANGIVQQKKNPDLVTIADTLMTISRSRAQVKLQHQNSHRKAPPPVTAAPGTPQRQAEEMALMFWDMNDRVDNLATQGKTAAKNHFDGGFWLP